MATVTREVLEERWACQTRDVQRFAGEWGLSGVNSERWNQVNDGLEELAAFLVEEVRDSSPDNTLDQLVSDLWDIIRERSIAWALEVETRRAGKAAAA